LHDNLYKEMLGDCTFYYTASACKKSDTESESWKCTESLCRQCYPGRSKPGDIAIPAGAVSHSAEDSSCVETFWLQTLL